jgi:N-acetyl-anhydromuramyl-L-alanine amidase AmpD
MENFDINSLPFDIIPLPCNSYGAERPLSNIKAIVLHGIGVPLEEVVQLFNELEVSAHYFIPQVSAAKAKEMLNLPSDYPIKYLDKAPVFELVSMDKISYHAGRSQFGELNKESGCECSLNGCTIGIEFHCPGYDGKYHFTPYNDLQREIGVAFVAYLLEVLGLSEHDILAHSIIAPDRKTDPGPLFFWDLFPHAEY